MSANKQPIFSSAPDIGWTLTPILVANTAKDGTGVVLLIWTADATNGGYIQRIIAKSLGTNTATVLRIFINNGDTPTVASNNSLLVETTLTATVLSEISALPSFEIPLNIAIPKTFRLYATIGTTVAAGYQLTAIAGKY